MWSVSAVRDWFTFHSSVRPFLRNRSFILSLLLITTIVDCSCCPGSFIVSFMSLILLQIGKGVSLSTFELCLPFVLPPCTVTSGLLLQSSMIEKFPCTILVCIFLLGQRPDTEHSATNLAEWLKKSIQLYPTYLSWLLFVNHPASSHRCVVCLNPGDLHGVR